MRSLRQSALLTVVLMLLACALAYAGKEFAPPRASHAKTYPAHDEHANERVVVAVDPFDTEAKADVFRTKWGENGYLPVRLIVSNDGDQPVALTKLLVELVTARRSKIQPATNEDLYRRISRIRHRGDEPRNLPLPFPRQGPRVGVDKKVREEVEAAQFKALAVEPHGSQSGFVFFDVQGIREPLAGAKLYVSGVRDSNGQELMFFEIPLDKYLARPAGQ